MMGPGGCEVELAHATFGGGCFWCLEPVFASLHGVREVRPGYAGGHVEHPSYEEVCTGSTGHAEVVDVACDPEAISYRDLLEVFFAVHDPTTRDRQGNDVGSQYRSVLLYRTAEQEEAARAFITALPHDPHWEGQGVTTAVEPLHAFYPAEDYHRDYFRRNPGAGYCRVVIAPKVRKFQQRFAGRLGLSD